MDFRILLIRIFMPIESESFKNAIVEAFSLAKWYTQEHVLLCLIPAFFIAGVITVFVSQNSVIKYFGARAKRWVAYLVASVSCTILAVCSCTVLVPIQNLIRVEFQQKYHLSFNIVVPKSRRSL